MRLSSYWMSVVLWIVPGAAFAACVTSANSWQNNSIGAQSGSFTVSFDATPAMAKMDGVMGLSNGPAASFTNLAAAVRFNNTGTIDARNGGAYAAGASIPYNPGQAYHFRLAVNASAHNYSAYVTPPGSTEKLIGSNYPFRTEQAFASTLSNLGVLADIGTESVCNWTASSQSAPPPPPPPPPAAPTWQNTSFTPQNGAFEAKFDATPGSTNMDGVIGFSNGPANAFTSLAAAVRFNNTGTIDARNAGSYAAASAIAYIPGTVYHFRVDVNVTNHSYSAYVTPNGGSEQLIGSNYAFRTEQASASSLNNMGAFADSGSQMVANLAVTPSIVTPPPPPPPVTSNYDATVLNDRPIAFWDMKNPTGTETDLTGNGHNGTYKGSAPTLTTLPDGEPVDDFNTLSGQQQYMTVASPADHSFSIPTTKQLTWEAWIRPDVLQFAKNTGSGYVDWMGKCEVYGGNTSQEPCEWEARMYSTTTSESPNRPNRVSAYVFNAGAGLGSAADWQPAYNGPSSNIYASSIVQAKDWLHIVGEYQTVNNGTDQSCGTPAGTITIWVNGVMWSQSNHAPTGCFSQYGVTPSAGSSPVDIGTMALDGWFQGAIGKVAIYNTLLSQSQITAHYAAMTGAQPSGSCGNTCTAAFPVSK